MKTVVKQGIYGGYDYLVLFVNGSHYCGYVKIPESHPLHGRPYDYIDVECHGGLTFGRVTDFDHIRETITNGYWIGWDYAHVGDYCAFMPDENDKKWTPDEVEAEAKHVIDQLIEKE